jgi:long-chain acyl-CoA synthetase
MEVGTIPLEPNQVGELVVRGPQVMLGYWNRPDETATALRNRWLYTGDIAYMDDEGYFFIVDRKKDMILSGGYNVYPREIDEVLLEHPGVKEAVAVGVSHPTRGEIIKAYVVPKEGVELTRGEVISFCREKLANYKIPKKVEFREELPKTMVGKVLRRALREEEERKAGRRAEDRNKEQEK